MAGGLQGGRSPGTRALRSRENADPGVNVALSARSSVFADAPGKVRSEQNGYCPCGAV